MPYLNRTIRFDYPELGDDIWVVIHNPMLMPMSVLRPESDVEIVNGQVADLAQATDATYEIISKLIITWNVYDPLDVSEEPNVLPLPATIETCKKLPLKIVMDINESAGKAFTPEKTNI